MNPSANHIENFFSVNNRMPTFQEVQKLYGYKSKSAASYFIDKLIEAHFLGKTNKGKLFLINKPGIPFFQSRIPAGFPSPAEEELIDTLSLDDYLIGNREATFMLTVQGHSMVEACIADGDLIIVERRDTFNNNDIVVAQVEDGYTVKYFKKRGNTFWLEPANKEFQNIIPTEESPIKIIAVVTAVIRKM